MTAVMKTSLEMECFFKVFHKVSAALRRYRTAASYARGSLRSEETLSSTQHEAREGTFPSLEGGAKPNVAFNSKRITRSEPKLAGPALIFGGYSADLLCDVSRFHSDGHCQMFLGSYKMYENCITNEKIQRHGVIGYTVKICIKNYGMDNMHVLIYLKRTTWHECWTIFDSKTQELVEYSLGWNHQLWQFNLHALTQVCKHQVHMDIHTCNWLSLGVLIVSWILPPKYFWWTNVVGRLQLVHEKSPVAVG